MSYWRSEYDDGWWTFYKDGIEIKFDNPNFGDLIVDEINNANQRIAELKAEIQEYRCLCEDWALVETDDSIKLAMIEASKPEVNNE